MALSSPFPGVPIITFLAITKNDATYVPFFLIFVKNAQNEDRLMTMSTAL